MGDVRPGAQRKGRIVTEDYARGLARVDEPEPPAPAPAPEPGTKPDPKPQESVAYLTLAELRDADPRMPLSEGDCKSLESLAAEWLARGSTPGQITRALTEGLPPAVTNPGGLARTRLESKMPPSKAKIRQKAAPRRARVTRAVMACVTCDADERTVRIDGGMCPDCRAAYEADLAAEAAGTLDAGYAPDTFLAAPDAVHEIVDVPLRAAEVRAGIRPRCEKAR